MSGGTNLLKSREDMEQELFMLEKNSLQRLSHKNQQSREVCNTPSIAESCAGNVPLENKLVIVSVRSCAEFPPTKETDLSCMLSKETEMNSHINLEELNKKCTILSTRKYLPFKYASLNENVTKEMNEATNNMKTIKDNKLDDFAREEKEKVNFSHKPPSAMKNDNKPLHDTCTEKMSVSFGNPMCTVIKISPKKDTEPTISDERVRKRRITNAVSKFDVLDSSIRRSERLKKCDYVEKHAMSKNKAVVNDMANSSPVRNNAMSMAYIKPLMIRLKRSRIPIDDTQTHIPALPSKLTDNFIGKPKKNNTNTKINHLSKINAKPADFNVKITQFQNAQQSIETDEIAVHENSYNVSKQKNVIIQKSVQINKQKISNKPTKREKRLRDSSANTEKSKKKVKLKLSESTDKIERRNSISVKQQKDIAMIGSLINGKTELANMVSVERQSLNVANEETINLEKSPKNKTKKIDNFEGNQCMEISQKPQIPDANVFAEIIHETTPASLQTNADMNLIQDETFQKSVKQRELRKRAKSMALTRLKESLLEMVNLSSEKSIKPTDNTVSDSTADSSLSNAAQCTAIEETESSTPKLNLAKNSKESTARTLKQVQQQSTNTAESIDCMLESAMNIILDLPTDMSKKDNIDDRVVTATKQNTPTIDLECVSKLNENENSKCLLASTSPINDLDSETIGNKKGNPMLEKDLDSKKGKMEQGNKKSSVGQELEPKLIEKEIITGTKSIKTQKRTVSATVVTAPVKKTKTKDKFASESKREKIANTKHPASEPAVIARQLGLSLNPMKSATVSKVNETKFEHSDTLTVKIPLTAMLSINNMKKDSKLKLVRKKVVFELSSNSKGKFQTLSDAKTDGKGSELQPKTKDVKMTEHGSCRSYHANEKISKLEIKTKYNASKQEFVKPATINSATVDNVPNLKMQQTLVETDQQPAEPAEINSKQESKIKTDNTVVSKTTVEFDSATTKNATYSFAIPNELSTPSILDFENQQMGQVNGTKIPDDNETSKIFDNVENIIEFNSEIIRSLSHHVHEVEPPEVAATEIVITETEDQHIEDCMSICSALQSTIDSVAAEKAVFTSSQQHQKHQQEKVQSVQQQTQPLIQSQDCISISSGTTVCDELDIYSPSTSLTLLANTAASTAPIPARRHSCVIVVPSMAIINGEEQPLMNDLIMQEAPCNSQQYTFSDITIANATVVPPIVDTVMSNVVKVTEVGEIENVVATPKENGNDVEEPAVSAVSEYAKESDEFEVIKMPVKEVKRTVENNADDVDDDNDNDYRNDSKSDDNLEEEDTDANDYVLSVGANERFIGIPTMSKDGSYSFMNIETTATVPAYLFNGESRDVPTPTPTPTVNVYAPTTVTAMEPTVFNDEELAASHEMYVSAPETPPQVNPLETCNNDSVIITSDHEVSSTQETEFEPTRRGSTISNQMKSCTNNIEATSPLMQDNQVDTTNIHLLQNKRRRIRKYSTYDDVSDHIYPTPEGKRRKTFCTDILSQIIVTGNDSLFETRFKHNTNNNLDNDGLSTVNHDKLRTADGTCSSNQCTPITMPRRRGRKPKNTTPAPNEVATETLTAIDTGMESVASQLKARSYVKKTQQISDADSRQTAAADLYAFRDDTSRNCDSPTTVGKIRHTYIKSPAAQVFVPPDMEKVLDIYQEEHIPSDDNQDTSATAAVTQKQYMTLNGAKLKVLPTRSAKLDKSPKRSYTPKTITTRRRR